MITPTLFLALPDYVCTPDGMAIDKDGNLILSCPNFADDNMSGCIVRIHKDMTVEKWFDVPVHQETKLARNMGIAFDSDWNLYVCDNQGWSGREDMTFQGRILKIKADYDGTIQECTVVAKGMEHPNGIKIRGNSMYVTQSCLSKVEDPSGKLVSCVYRFGLEDKDIEICNTLEDANILTTFITQNPECQYGADGIEFDPDGRLYVGNFGDGEIVCVELDESGTKVLKQYSYAKNPEELVSTDGMFMDEQQNLYVADFSANAIVKVSPDRTVKCIAKSPDCDGLDGGLDQPGEPIIWNGALIASCFDLVTDEGKVNTAHELPATMSRLEIE